jgi:EAP30/Vps36 family
VISLLVPMRTAHAAHSVEDWSLLMGSQPRKAGAPMQAVKKLEILDKSFTVIPDPAKVANKKGTKFYVSSVPREIDMAFQDVFQAAQGQGCVSQPALAQLPKWSAERAKLTLGSMVQEGVCMVDEGDPTGETLYWFPVLSEQQV